MDPDFLKMVSDMAVDLNTRLNEQYEGLTAIKMALAEHLSAQAEAIEQFAQQIEENKNV